MVHNPDWAEGQATSLQAGRRRAAAAHGHDAVVVGLGDQPVRRGGGLAGGGGGHARPIAVATYDGPAPQPRPAGHRSVWPLLPVDGDEGARRADRHAKPDLVEPR